MPLNRICVVLPLLILGGLFATTLAGRDRLAFRDVSHFYTPLYDYVASRTSAGGVPLWKPPLWNPLDQTGHPLIGETTTAVFYPLRLAVYALPLTTETAMAWYVVAHLILASLAARLCSRLFRVSKRSSTVAAIVYPLSGGVLFLFTNPPFLVGAAWLPLVLGFSLSPLRIPPMRRLLVLGASLAMMVLGGDPQTAFHAIVMIGVIQLACLVIFRTGDRLRAMTLTIAGTLLAIGLAAPQIAASVSWSRQSARVATAVAEDWTQPPVTGSRRGRAFEFSLPPWHLTEVITPNAYGSLVPINRRLSRLIAGDGRMWTPTIYLGMLTAIALLGRLISARKRGADVWLAIAILSLLLAMGHFGFVWLLQNLTGRFRGIDSAIGGPYWFLYQFLPGYDAFRYPAKWLPFFSLAAAVIAAHWLDRDLFDRVRWNRRVVGACLVVSLLAGMTAFIIGLESESLVGQQLRIRLADRFWGPLDVAGGMNEIQRSLMHSTVCLALMFGMLRWRSRYGGSRAKFRLAFVALLTIDVSLVAAGMVKRVNVENERALITMLTAGDRVEGEPSAWMRTQAGGGWPRRWRESSDPHRLIDVEASERAAWFGRWHLSPRQNVFNNMASIRSRPAAEFWQSASQNVATLPPGERAVFWQHVRRWLALDGVVRTTSDAVEVVTDDRLAALVDIDRGVDRQPRYQAYARWAIVNDAERQRDLWRDVMRDLRGPPKLWVPRVVIHGDASEFFPVDAAAGSSLKIDVTLREPEQEVLEVRSDQRQLLARPTFQDGHWVAEMTPLNRDGWRPVQVFAVDFLKQGVIVPPGDWTIRFRYQPSWLSPSLVIAGMTWASVLALIMRSRFKNRSMRKSAGSV